jgi:hypothetical protein
MRDRVMRVLSELTGREVTAATIGGITGFVIDALGQVEAWQAKVIVGGMWVFSILFLSKGYFWGRR